LALREKELLAPKLSRPKLALINPSGIGGRRPKTGEMDITCSVHYTWNSKRVTRIDEVDG
jgi:hypothetical protein